MRIGFYRRDIARMKPAARNLTRISRMPLKYEAEQHREYLDLVERINVRWIDMLRGSAEFYSAAYWDLLTRMWRADRPVRKTDALGFMTGIRSAHTAGKYVETAIREGMILERDNPEDGRSKLLELSTPMRRRLDAYFDAAVDEVQRSVRRLDHREAGMRPDRKDKTAAAFVRIRGAG
jgi:hypothetical protein